MFKKFWAKSVKMKALCAILPLLFLCIIVLAFFFHYLISSHIHEKQESKLESIIHKISVRVEGHAKVAELLARSFELNGQHLTDQEFLDNLINFIKHNEDTFGAGVWYEPNKHKSSEKYFGPYVYRSNGEVVPTWDYNKPEYNYFKWDWYKMATNTSKSVIWTDPYFDPVANITMITASAPMYRANKFIGLTTADMSLDNIQLIANSLKMGKTGWAFIIDSKGNFVAYPDKEQVMKTQIQKSSNKDMARLGREILSKKEGISHFKDKNGKNIVYFAPILDTGMIIGITISEFELYATTVFNVIIAIIIFALIVTFVIDKLMTDIIVNPLSLVVKQLKSVASGNLNVKPLEINKEDEVGELADATNNTVDSLRKIIEQVDKISDEIWNNSQNMNQVTDQTAQGAQQTAISTSQLAQGAQQISHNIDQGVESITSLNKLIHKISKEAVIVAELGNQTEINASQGNQFVYKAVGKINTIKEVAGEITENISGLGKLSNQIEEIVDLIKRIAGQTNLLALNAAIEAARAGEHGKGFAVVAEEVKKLATESASATDKITEMIKEIQNKTTIAVSVAQKTSAEVDEGVQTITDAGHALESIISQVSIANDKIQRITKDIEFVAKNSDDVVRTVENITAITEETAAGAEEISSITQEQTASLEEISNSSAGLTKISKRLKEQISVFKI